MKRYSHKFRLHSIGIITVFFSIFCFFPPLTFGAQAEHVLLFVLEGVNNDSIEANNLLTLKKLAKEGAAKVNAQSISPPLTVSAMATLLTGLPVKKHRVNQEWERYDFSRSFLRSPTLFDYLDLAGGVDTALFIMDERFYQLSRPEIYVDMQTCGKAKPQCNPNTVVGHIEDYLNKVTSKGGYGFRLFTVPGLLVAHLPEPMDVALKKGWDSKAYKEALLSVDAAIGDVIELYRAHNVLGKTMVVVTGLNGKVMGENGQTNGSLGTKTHGGASVPWIAWGANVKSGHQIQHPVSIMDTGATVMESLGLETHTEWQSEPIRDIFVTTPERKTTGNENLDRLKGSTR